MNAFRHSTLGLTAITCVIATPAVARAARLAFVASEADGDVVVVDLDAEKVVTRCPRRTRS